MNLKTQLMKSIADMAVETAARSWGTTSQYACRIVSKDVKRDPYEYGKETCKSCLRSPSRDSCTAVGNVV